VDPLTLITIVAGIAGILGFLYLLLIGQKSLFEWWRERQTSQPQTRSQEKPEADQTPTVTTVPHENVAVSEKSSAILSVGIRFDKEGKLAHEEQELKATVSEVVFAIEHKRPLSVSVFLETVEAIQELSKSFERDDLSPEDRINKIKLLRFIDSWKERQVILSEAISMLFHYLYLPENEMIQSIQGLAYEFFPEKGPITPWAIDVWRPESPNFHAVIHLSEDEYKQLMEINDLATPYVLIGSGWDVFDLPREVMIKKAIPAILLEVINEKRKTEGSIELPRILDLNTWAIGLR